MTYFEWLSEMVCDSIQLITYQKLFSYLYDRPFYWSVNYDGNRAADGFALRAMYECKTGNPCEKTGACSVLEVLIGLSMACESDLMYDPEEGDRTPEWFWMMIENMGLDYMDDNMFNYDIVEEIVDSFLDRTYGTDGYGGPFYIPGIKVNMRDTELWYQLNYYLQENFPI